MHYEHDNTNGCDRLLHILDVTDYDEKKTNNRFTAYIDKKWLLLDNACVLHFGWSLKPSGEEWIILYRWAITASTLDYK